MSENDRIRVLGIVGSPRRGGNTEILVDQVLRGAEEAGAVIEKVILSELDIHPCRGCGACRKAGQCVQKDDMATLLEQMRVSQVWVLGTPIYWGGPTAQFKAFLDRWYSVEDRRDVYFEGRRIILAIPMHAPRSYIGWARHTVRMLTGSLYYLHAEVYTTIIAPGVGDRGEVREHPDILEEARQAGREATDLIVGEYW